MGTVLQFATKANSLALRQALAAGLREQLGLLAGQFPEREAIHMTGYCRGIATALIVLGDLEAAALAQRAAEQLAEDWRSAEYLLRSLHAQLNA